MTISFEKLWKLLADRKLKVKDLQNKNNTNISSTILAKMKDTDGNNHVSTRTLLKICKFLDCDICDIMEIKK